MTNFDPSVGTTLILAPVYMEFDPRPPAALIAQCCETPCWLNRATLMALYLGLKVSGVICLPCAEKAGIDLLGAHNIDVTTHLALKAHAARS